MINCSARKSIRGLPNLPSLDLDNEDKYASTLPKLPAYRMYVGLEFTKTIQYLNLSPDSVFILSARYGLIRGDQEIIPYNARITPSNYVNIVNGWVKSPHGNRGIKLFIGSRFKLLVVRLSRPYMLAFDYLVNKLSINPCIGDRVMVYSPIIGPFKLCNGVTQVRVRGQGDYVKKIRELMNQLNLG